MSLLNVLQRSTFDIVDRYQQRSDGLGIVKIVLLYIAPLCLLPPVMLYLVVQRYPKVFMDILPGDRLLMVGLGLWVFQVITVLVVTLITKHLAEIVDIKPSYRDTLIVLAASATPFWLVSVFYLVPSFSLNIALHALAALLASLLVYAGVQSVLHVKSRGAAIMLSMATVATASLAFGVVLVGTLMSWGGVQKLQFALGGS